MWQCQTAQQRLSPMSPPVASVRACVCAACVPCVLPVCCVSAVYMRAYMRACVCTYMEHKLCGTYNMCCVCTYMEHVCGTCNICYLYVAKMCTAKDVAYEPHRGIGPVLCTCTCVRVSAYVHVCVCVCACVWVCVWEHTHLRLCMCRTHYRAIPRH